MENIFEAMKVFEPQINPNEIIEILDWNIDNPDLIKIAVGTIEKQLELEIPTHVSLDWQKCSNNEHDRHEDKISWETFLETAFDQYYAFELAKFGMTYYYSTVVKRII